MRFRFPRDQTPSLTLTMDSPVIPERTKREQRQTEKIRGKILSRHIANEIPSVSVSVRAKADSKTVALPT